MVLQIEVFVFRRIHVRVWFVYQIDSSFGKVRWFCLHILSIYINVLKRINTWWLKFRPSYCLTFSTPSAWLSGLPCLLNNSTLIIPFSRHLSLTIRTPPLDLWQVGILPMSVTGVLVYRTIVLTYRLHSASFSNSLFHGSLTLLGLSSMCTYDFSYSYFRTCVHLSFWHLVPVYYLLIVLLVL